MSTMLNVSIAIGLLCAFLVAQGVIPGAGAPPVTITAMVQP